MSPTEKVIFETGPGVSHASPVLFWIGVVIVGFFLLELTYTVAIASVAGFVAVGVFGLLFGTPLWYALYAWRTTAYALTDQRVVLRNGSEYASAPITQIQRVSNSPGSSRIVFQLTPPPPGASAPGFLGRPRSELVWKATPFATAVVPFLESAILYYGLRARENLLRQDVRMAAMQGKITCAYCGTSFDPSVLNLQDPRCPSCAAPITMPGPG